MNYLTAALHILMVLFILVFGPAFILAYMIELGTKYNPSRTFYDWEIEGDYEYEDHSQRV